MPRRGEVASERQPRLRSSLHQAAGRRLHDSGHRADPPPHPGRRVLRLPGARVSRADRRNRVVGKAGLIGGSGRFCPHRDLGRIALGIWTGKVDRTKTSPGGTGLRGGLRCACSEEPRRWLTSCSSGSLALGQGQDLHSPRDRVGQLDTLSLPIWSRHAVLCKGRALRESVAPGLVFGPELFPANVEHGGGAVPDVDMKPRHDDPLSARRRTELRAGCSRACGPVRSGDGHHALGQSLM